VGVSSSGTAPSGTPGSIPAAGPGGAGDGTAPQAVKTLP
jgi:hypothetical protein